MEIDPFFVQNGCCVRVFGTFLRVLDESGGVLGGFEVLLEYFWKVLGYFLTKVEERH